MNWKVIVIGGVLLYVATFIVSMITGPLIHNGILLDDYQATAQFWRPELMQQPPDMAALMPRWIASGLIGAFIFAGIYDIVRRALSGAGWKRGLKYGVMLALFNVAWNLGYAGVFNLPENIWAWWTLDGALMYLAGGAVLGWIAERLAPVSAAVARATF
jgi:hypothetical protein